MRKIMIIAMLALAGCADNDASKFYELLGLKEEKTYDQSAPAFTMNGTWLGEISTVTANTALLVTFRNTTGGDSILGTFKIAGGAAGEGDAYFTRPDETSSWSIRFDDGPGCFNQFTGTATVTGELMAITFDGLGNLGSGACRGSVPVGSGGTIRQINWRDE